MNSISPKETLFHELTDIVGKDQVLISEPMARHTTFEVGGPAQFFVVPVGLNQTEELLNFLTCKQVPYFVLGRGSDLVVSDEGFPGVVVDLSQGLTDVEVDGDNLTAQAGVSLIDLSEMAAALSLSGLEFACGIPGTVGGAVYMNAGAYGGTISDVLKSACVRFKDGTIKTLSADELDFGYRMSKVRAEKLTVLSATFQLTSCEPEIIRTAMQDFTERRSSKQPLELPSAGSAFKRPAGYFAGKLVGDAGLSGYQVGGIQVSEKHNGFLVKVGDATASDVYKLVRHIQDEVRRQFGVDLETEIQFLGSF